jgi:hypothetical protein
MIRSKSPGIQQEYNPEIENVVSTTKEMSMKKGQPLTTSPT